MARVNIEDRWWSDPRRLKLILKIGFCADSAAVNLWRTAQEFWKQNKGRIPTHVFETIEYSKELAECGLAIVENETVYVRGSSDCLDWVRQKRDIARENASKGGKASAKARQEKYGSAIPTGASNGKIPEAKPKQNRTDPNASYSYSSSKKEERESQKPESLPRLALLWNEFSEPPLGKVQRMQTGSKRRRLCEAKWSGNPNEDFWKDVICRINRSDFCSGKNVRGWRADIDFLLTSDGPDKVLEGKYDNRPSGLSLIGPRKVDL